MSIKATKSISLLGLLHVSAWTMVFLLSWGAFYRMMPLSESIFRSFCNTALLMVLFYGVGWLYHKWYEHHRYGNFGVGVIVIMLIVSFLRYQINLQFSYLPGQTDYYEPGKMSFFFGAVFTNLLALLNSLLYHTVRSRMALEQRQTQLQSEQQAAQLQFLRAQMNPHFLFNTLNNIYSLAVMRSEKTAPLVLRLSELLRYVTYETQDEKVPLEKEVKMLEEYIELFQLQHEERLAIHFDYPLPDTTIKIEPLLLVPIVENCFKHCDFAENEHAFTRLRLYIKESKLYFEAENTFNPAQKQKDQLGGVGLDNIRKRLQLRYPNQHQLAIKEHQEVFSVHLMLQLPQTHG